jgi:hypothetical protein
LEEDMTRTWAERIRLPTTKRIVDEQRGRKKPRRRTRRNDADADAEDVVVVVERTGRGRKERVNGVGVGDGGEEKEKGKRISLVAAGRESAEARRKGARRKGARRESAEAGRKGPKREVSQSDGDDDNDEGERESRRSNPPGDESRIRTLRETLGEGKVLSDDVEDGGEAEVETLDGVPPLAEKEGNRGVEKTAGAEEEGGDAEGSAEDEDGARRVSSTMDQEL